MSEIEESVALVTAAFGRRGRLETGDGAILKYLVKGRRLRVVCGDRVRWRREPHGGDAIVTGVDERDNMLQRVAGEHGEPEILAANLTCLAVVCAPLPETDWFLVDRYLAAGELMGCRLLLIDNKQDLADAKPGSGRRAELSGYLALGYRCLPVSSVTGDGVDALAAALQDEIALLVGQSGVGKSSLINRLVPDASIVVGEVSAATREGTHTTTASAMHRLPGGGRLIDTPGVRDFVPALVDRNRVDTNRVQVGFPEIVRYAADCRFNDCRHLREPGCAVKQAVEAGEIGARRYESYRRLARVG